MGSKEKSIRIKKWPINRPFNYYPPTITEYLLPKPAPAIESQTNALMIRAFEPPLPL